jgi:hypothetical protein
VVRGKPDKYGTASIMLWKLYTNRSPTASPQAGAISMPHKPGLRATATLGRAFHGIDSINGSKFC